MFPMQHHPQSPRKAAAQFEIHDDTQDPEMGNCEPSTKTDQDAFKAQNEAVQPLGTSKLANRAANPILFNDLSKEKKSGLLVKELEDYSTENLLAKLAINDDKQAKEDRPCEERPSAYENMASNIHSYKLSKKPSLPEKSGVVDFEKVRLKRELDLAKDKIAQMDQELSQSRITNHSLEMVLGSPSESGIGLKDVTEQLFNNLQHIPKQKTTGSHVGSTSERSNTVSPKPYETFPGGWEDSDGLPHLNAAYSHRQHRADQSWNPHLGTAPAPGFSSRFQNAPFAHRPANLRLENLESDRACLTGPSSVGLDQVNQKHFDQAPRSTSALLPRYNVWPPYAQSTEPSSTFGSPITPLSFPSMNYGGDHQPYQPRPIGTPLSPTAMDFNSSIPLSSSGMQQGFNPWNPQSLVQTQSNATYMPPMEPMNYRRLLDRNMNCNWKYIVDKIVCSNDQQASIFLQQKLKVSTPEQKFELIEAIIAQAYPLMINRFGNFLIQRCFEHGTPHQVVAIANAIRGNTLTLSMDAFGCHVIQKAFDVVPEDYKAIMVHELLRRIPETVIHRYACHVWQKLFELRWSDSPPQIMKYVNEALQGMWHEVALGETGSLVVQNIFENCLEEDKRPCIEEVLASIDIVSHGQFGNWCIQHICEHGAPADKSRAIEHVLRFATEYSTDQFASKVVEKCLKVGGNDFLERYLEKVCEGRADRPRMPLIDIAGDQYGNYLVQFILMNADSQHREVVASHVRKHMVSLRGSKFGSRVAMLCSNPAFATRPGPPSTMPVNDRFFNTNNGGVNRSMSLSGPRY